MSSAFKTLSRMKDEQLEETAVIMTNGDRTYSICGVYVDDVAQTVTLMNGYFARKPVNWVKQKFQLY